ncbi:MAG: MerR family transcriptional regulator [Pseudomonadota bacterium]
MTELRNYSISELAKEFDVTTRTLRFYEEKGWLNPRRERGRRVFSSKDRTRLRLILRGRRIGLSLEESVEIIDLYDSPAGTAGQAAVLLERLAERRQALRAQRADIDAMLNSLATVEQRVRAVVNDDTASRAGDGRSR